MTNLPPGVTATATTTNPPRSSPTSTGRAFLPLIASRAPADPVVLRSMDDYLTFFDARQSFSEGYDWCDTVFHEGGDEIIAQAVVGPNPVAASANIPGTSGTGLVVTAVDKGEWANGATGGLTWEIANGPSGSSTRVLILRKNGVEISRTVEQTTNQAIVDAGFPNASYAKITIGGGSGLVPVAAAANLTGGTLDRTNITDTQVKAAVDKFGVDLGPGNIAAPDWTTDSIHDYLLAHAAARNRFAVLDTADTTSKSTVTAAATHLQGAANSSYGALYAPWLTVPGITDTVPRSVPPSALFCGRAAVVDAADGPNQAPAGNWGIARYVIGVKAAWSADTIAGVNDVGDLNASGVNLVRVIDDQVQIYGNRTLVSPAGAERNWLQASNARYRMSVIARAKQRGKAYVFKKVTRTSIDGFHDAVTGLMLADYINQDLFGDLGDDRPETAFNVKTDEPVNTPATIQAGELNVQVAFRPARGAEMVRFTFNAVALTEPVA